MHEPKVIYKYPVKSGNVSSTNIKQPATMSTIIRTENFVEVDPFDGEVIRTERTEVIENRGFGFYDDVVIENRTFTRADFDVYDRPYYY